MNKRYIPRRGDIVWTDFDPVAGHEQAHRRPALILSPESFNRHMKLALVAPITNRIRKHGFEVKLNQTQTEGVALCHQARTIDFDARGIRFIESAPIEVLDDALAKVKTLLD